MLKASTSMSRPLDKRLDKQSDSQELFKAGSTFAPRIQSNNQISTDNESEVRKPSDSEKEEQTKAEKNGLKSKAWKPVAEGEANGDVIKESNGTTIQHTSSDSPDNKISDKLDSPTSSSTPNDSSEISSLSESPSLLHDDPKLKISNITATSITSEDESSSKMDALENNRMCKKRRWDERDQNENEDDVEVQEDLKKIEIDFVQLRDQLYREQIQELDKEIAEIKQDDLENRRFKLIREKNNLDDYSRIDPLHAVDIDEDFALMGYPDVSSSGDRFLHLGQSFKKGDAVLVIDSTSGRYTAKFLAATDSE
ncbi:17913_t:CDS:2, partial [Racocetra fulgida]